MQTQKQQALKRKTHKMDENPLITNNDFLNPL